jgi:hypothetical protein
VLGDWLLSGSFRFFLAWFRSECSHADRDGGPLWRPPLRGGPSVSGHGGLGQPRMASTESWKKIFRRFFKYWLFSSSKVSLATRVTWDRCYDFLIFSPKKWPKLAFLIQKNAKLCKILIIISVLWKNAKFFAEKCRKSHKIVIITSTPDWANFRLLGECLCTLDSFFRYRYIPKFVGLLFPR